MAIQDLEVIVTVNVSKALSNLKDLQDSLEDIARGIRRVDNRGQRGINVNTDIDPIDEDLAYLSGRIEAWERRNSITIDTDVRGFDPPDVSDVGGQRDIDADRDVSVATMDVDANVVNLTGFNIRNFQDTARNAVREGMVDAMQSEEITAFFSGPRRDDDDDDDDDRSFRRRMQQIRMDFEADDIGFGRATRRLTRQFGNVAGNTKLANLSMSDLHNALARVIPLLVVFIGTIPALISAFVTLAAAAFSAAAALVAIGGLGALGFAMADGTTEVDTQRLQEVLSDVADDFLEAFAPLANRLEPLFRDALSGLDRFFEAIARQGDVLVALTDEARAFGGFLIDFVPQALRALGALVEVMAAEFGGIGDFLNENFTNVIRTMAETTLEALPAIAHMMQLITDMIPPLIRMSVGFIKVTNAILTFVGVIGWLIGQLGINAEVLGIVIASTLTLATAYFALSAAAKLLGLGIIKYVIRSLTLYIGNALVAAGATYSLAFAVATLLSILTLGVFAVVAAGIFSIGTNALSAKSKVDDLNSSLREFDRLAGGDGPTLGTDGPDDGRGPPRSGSGGGMSMTYNDFGGDNDPDEANAYAAWRYNRTTGDRA